MWIRGGALCTSLVTRYPDKAIGITALILLSNISKFPYRNIVQEYHAVFPAKLLGASQIVFWEPPKVFFWEPPKIFCPPKML